MATHTQIPHGICREFSINGKIRYFSRLQGLQQIDRNHYVAIFTHGTYKIEGGKKLGGTRHDWFIDGQPGAALQGTMNASGIIDALKLLDGA